jgi:hypothetical protein
MPNPPERDDEPPATAPEYRYWAFISYSHRDSAWAKRLHSKLETWALPAKLVGRATPLGKLPPRLFPIFLDRDEISGGQSLDEVIRAALKLSRYLIVLCSPYSAGSKYVNEEIRSFKAMGRGARIVYLIVSGDPAGDGSLDPKTGACFPPMARCQVGLDGAPTEERIEPVAADARPGKDGWRDSILKVLARLLDVGFDELKLREARRQRRARLVAAMLTSGIVLLLAAAFLAAADAGLHMPLCDNLRLWLDRRELSVFRHVKSAAEIRAAAGAIEANLTTALLSRRQDDGWINDAAPGKAPVLSTMSHDQAMAAWAAAPTASGSHSAKLIQSLEAPYHEGIPVVHDGVKWGWPPVLNGPVPDSFVAAWAAIALSEAIGDPTVKADPAATSRLSEHLKYTQEVLALYHHEKDPGAWDMFPYQVNADQHSVYASTLVLIGLAAARRADLPWDGSLERRDELLHQTVQWLVNQYHSEGPRHGWLNDPAEEHVNDVFDGLTAETYSALMEAEEADPTLALPAAMREDIRLYLVSCGTRAPDYAVDVGEFRIGYHRADGSTEVVIDSMRYLWWPWVIRSAALWLRYADVHHLPPEQRVQVRRTLAHLIIDLGPQEAAKATSGYSYMISESLFCLRRSFLAE